MSKIAYTYTMNNNTIDAAIASIAKRTATLTQDYQRLAVSVLQAWKQHGDKPTAIRRANQIVTALGKGMRANSMAAWFQQNSPMVWNKETKELVFGVVSVSPIRSHEAIEDAKALSEKLWYEAIKQEEPQPLQDWNKLILQLVAKGEKDLKDHGESSKVNTAHLALLKQMAEGKAA